MFSMLYCTIAFYRSLVYTVRLSASVHIIQWFHAYSDMFSGSLGLSVVLRFCFKHHLIRLYFLCSSLVVVEVRSDTPGSLWCLVNLWTCLSSIFSHLEPAKKPCNLDITVLNSVPNTTVPPNMSLTTSVRLVSVFLPISASAVLFSKWSSAMREREREMVDI